MRDWLTRERRRIHKARKLLEHGIPNSSEVWADLGCGDGIFTAALYDLLGHQGKIYAVDKNPAKLQRLTSNFRESFSEATLQTVKADFTKPIQLPHLDGIVMANSIHFVRPQKRVLGNLISHVKPGGRVIIVEYNTTRGNFAVPHPLGQREFLDLASEVGLLEPRIIARIPSTFLGEMYAGLGIVKREDIR